MKLFNATFIQTAGMLFICTMLVSACSGSSDSSTVEEQGDGSGSIESGAGNEDTPPGNATDTEADAAELPTDDDTIGDGTENTPVEMPGEGSSGDNQPEPVIEPEPEPETEPTIPVVPDPPVESMTQVDFEITVPVYSSDALKVLLEWGEYEISANWIGDQFWSVTAELPADTEQLLAVTFSDNNGEVGLAGFEQTYRTGNNDAETYSITVDQFDTERFDTDEDGVSNLAELLAGTDPLVDELALLEVRDTILLGRETFASETAARKIPKERPFSLYLEDHPPEPEYGQVFHTTISIELDEIGNGAYSELVLKKTRALTERDALTLEATRVNTGESIVLEGSLSLSNGNQDYENLYYFSNEISAMDSDTRSYVGETNTAHFYTSPEVINSTYDLTVRTNEDSDYCEPIAGTIERDNIFNRYIYYDENRPAEQRIRRLTTVSKEVGDQYWHVLVVNYDDGSLVEEYLARAIRIEVLEERGTEWIQGIEWANLESEFVCDLVDF